MRPVKILFENFKARSAEYTLAPVVMFAGENETGKTACINAIEVAIKGYHHAVGRQPSSTWKFAGQNKSEMTVHIEMDTEAFKTVTFKRKTNGDVSRTVKGELPDVPEVLFDVSDYLSATAQERIKAVFDRIDVSKITIKDEELLERLGKLEAVPAAVSQVAVSEMITEVKKTITRRAALKQTPQLWLEELVKTLTDTAKGQKGSQDTAAGQLLAMKPSGTTPVSVADQLKVEKEKLAELEKVKSDLESKRSNYMKHDARRKEIEAILAKPTTDTATWVEQKKKLDAQIAEYQSDTPTREAYVTNLIQEHKKLEATITQAGAEITEMELRLQELEGKVKCPYCKSSRQGWKEEYKTELTQKLDALKADTKQKTDQLQHLKDEGAKARADLNASQSADAAQKKRREDVAALNNKIVLAQKDKTDQASLEGELRGLQSIEYPSDESRTKAINDIVAQKAIVLDLENKELSFGVYDSNRKTRTTLEEKLIGYQVRVEIYKQAAKVVTEAQKEIVSKAFESILAPARRFTDGIIDGNLDYQNDELGYHSPAGWVSHDVMSGRGKDLAYLGLQVALAQQSPIKIVLIDEFGDFDTKTKLKVVQRLIELAREKFIDGAYCTDPDPNDFSTINDPDFKLVTLEKSA
jgi:hypothetical protein